MDPLSSLSDLPLIAAGCVRDCDRARRDLVRVGASAVHASEGGITTLPWLGPVQLTWRFYLAWEQQRILLSFWRRPKEIEVALDSTLQFRVEPGPPPPRPSPDPNSESAPASDASTAPTPDPSLNGSTPPPPLSRLSWPRFLGPSSPDLAIFHVDHGSMQRRLELPILRDSIDFGSARLLEGEQRLTIRQGNRLLLEPFVDWIETVGNWMRAPDSKASWRPLPPPTATESLPARRILASIVDTYRQASDAASSEPTPTPPLLAATVDWIPHRQALTAFSGRTWLRLRQDGTAIAEKNTEEPTTLEMRYTLGHEDGRDQLDVQLQPPDFLLTGDLHHQILTTVAQAALEARWHRRGGKLGRETDLSEVEALEFLTQPDATVMRIRRKRDRDLDLILLRGPLRGTFVWAVLTAWVVIEKAPTAEKRGAQCLRLAKPPTATTQHGATALTQAFERENDALNCVFIGERFSNDALVPNGVLQSFGRLMLAMHRWGGIWPAFPTENTP